MNRHYFDISSTLRYCWLGAAWLTCVTAGCNRAGSTTSPSSMPAVSEDGSALQQGKTGVLLISHGSHSENWREMLQDIEHAVRDEVLESGEITEIRSAFMEYTEPSIATQLKQFDHEGYTDVILVPLLLTVSSHSFDDIPTIAGQKQDHMTTETLGLEGIEIYTPKAQVTIAPLLDFPSVLAKNVARRTLQMSEVPTDEGIVLVAYGSEQYDEEWKQLLDRVSREVKSETGVDCSEYSWCGHIARYKSEPTEAAIRKVLQEKQRAIVIPVLVAVDETFQGKIIGGAIKNVDETDRIAYRHDAILPDENINKWVVDISHELASKLANGEDTSRDAP